MKNCEMCKINVRTSKESCPLCGHTLIEEKGSELDNTDVFPIVKTLYEKYNLFFRILIFATVVISVTSVLINMIAGGGMWSLLVLLGAASLWFSLATIIKKRRNLQKTILYHVLIISFISILWDLATGWRGWSIEYVVPAVCVVAMLLLAIFYTILDMPINAYLIYLIVDAFFGIIPIIFYLTDCLDVYIPSLICVAVSLISIAAMISFFGREMLAEMKRRFFL